MRFMKVCVLGSTGSIGTQALEVIEENDFIVTSLSFHSNEALGREQILKYKPKYVAISDEAVYKNLIPFLEERNIKHSGSPENIITEEVDIVLNAIVGSAGLISTLTAIEKGKKIALANKESLCIAGELVNKYLDRNKNAKIYPVDSEHSAIWQCMESQSKGDIKKIILTASGGPFLNWPIENIKKATKTEALKHPNWVMGSKITIDSATLMNKALEVIEAHFLFDKKIEVLVHPQSIVHSMVEYNDGQVMAQLGPADMRLPISYALTYPKRPSNNFETLNLLGKTLTFEEVRSEFKAIELSYRAIKQGGTMPAVLNAANEVCVIKFLNDEIGFLDIQEIVEKAMDMHKSIHNYTLEEVLEVDKWARNFAHSYK